MQTLRVQTRFSKIQDGDYKTFIPGRSDNKWKLSTQSPKSDLVAKHVCSIITRFFSQTKVTTSQNIVKFRYNALTTFDRELLLQN